MARLRCPVTPSDIKTELSTCTVRPQYSEDMLQHVLHTRGMVLSWNQVGCRDGSRVDNGIERSIQRFVQHNGIECFSRRFHSDIGKHMFDTMRIQSHSKDEGLGNGLNCENFLTVACFDHLSFNGADADSEVIRICCRQLRNIVGHLTVVTGRQSSMQVSQHLAQRCGGGSCSTQKQIKFIGGGFSHASSVC